MTSMGDCSPVISAAIFRASNVIVPNNAGRGEPDFGALPHAERTEGQHGLALFDPGLILESVTSPGTVKVNFANYQLDRCAAARCARLLRLGCERRADVERHDEAQ